MFGFLSEASAGGWSAVGLLENLLLSQKLADGALQCNLSELHKKAEV